MRRLSLVLSVSALVVLGLFLLAPVAGAVNPPEGDWAWSQPYVPADGPHAFRAAETSRAKAYSRLDGHWNATGHRLAAQSLPPVALEALRTRSAR